MYKKLLFLLPLLFLFSCNEVETIEKSTEYSTEYSTELSTVDNQGVELIIRLVGDETIWINIDSEYIDLGLDFVYDGDNDITYYLDGFVDTSSEGQYTLKYIVYLNNDYFAEITRIINVQDINPTITFSEPIYICNTTEYIDYFEGLTAFDYLSEDILSSVELDTTSVYQNQPGKYEITYSVTDSFGNSFEVNRDVFVNYYSEQTFNTEDNLSEFYEEIQSPIDISVLLGDSVALDDEIIAVGAPAYMTHGAVIIYDTDGNQLMTIEGSNYLGEPNHPLQFGTEVALTDKFLIVGSPEYLDENINLGAIILFPRTGNTFDTENPLILQQENVSQYESLGFGQEFITQGDFLIVSNSIIQNNLSRYSVMVYKLNETQDNYNLVQKIFPESSNDYNFGYHLTLENDYLVISTELSNLDKDKVYLYKYNGTNFSLQESYIPEDHTQSGRFGTDVAIYDNYMFVSTPSHFSEGKVSGAIYLYDLTKSTSELGGVISFNSPTLSMYEGFGKAIEVIGEYLLVTSNKIEINDTLGKGIYIYRISDLVNGDFTPIGGYLLNNQLVGSFGSTLSVNSDTILIGSPTTAAYTYKSGSIDILSFDSETISFKETKLIDDQYNNYTVTMDDVEVNTFFTPSNLEDGTYQLVSTTSEGYTYTYRIIYDKTSPDIGRELIYSSNQTIQISSNELLGSYQLNDEKIIQLDTPTKTFSVELSENGEFTLDIYDVAGNVSTLTYIYDNEAPIVISELFEIGDIYQEISASQTWSFSRFGTTFDYSNNLLVGASKISKDRNVLKSYAFLFLKEGIDFTFLERIEQPYLTCDNFAKQVAVNNTQIFIASTFTDDSGTYDVIYIYNRDSDDFSIPDSVIEISQGTIHKMIIEDNNLVILYEYLDFNSVCIYDVSNTTYKRTNMNKSESESIVDISLSNNLLAMSSTESCVYIYDINTEAIRIIEQSGNTGGTSYLAIHNNMLAVRNSNSYNSYIYVYDLSLAPGFVDYKKEISLGGFNDGVSLALNNTYLAVGNSSDNVVYLFDFSSDDLQLSKKTINNSGWYFGNHLFMNDEFLLVSNPDSSFNTYAGAISAYYLKDFYQLNILDLCFDGDVFEIIDDVETPLNYPYSFDTNITVNILVRDLAGNEFTETNNYENLTIEFTNNHSVISETEYMIETNKYFNAYSLDNGETYITVDTTNHFLVEGLSDGEYTILVKYNDVCASNTPLKLIVDTQTPLFELIYNQISDIYKNKIFQLHSFKYRIGPAGFAVHEDYILIVYKETVETQVYQNKVYIFNRHLSEEDEGYLTVIESLTTTDYNYGLGNIYIEDDLLYFFSKEDSTQGSEVATYIYDLSKINTDDFLVKKISVVDNGSFISKVLFEDNYLFFTDKTEDKLGNSVNRILVYKYIEETRTFDFERQIVCSFDGLFRHIDYDNFTLVISSNSGEVCVYDLTQNSTNEQYIGTIEATTYHDHYDNPSELENVAIYDNLLVVYIEYPTNVYDEETEDQDKLFFYDLNDGDLIVDYIYDIDYDLESLNGLSGYSNNLQFLENGNLYVGKNYTVYNTELILDGISETDTIEEIHMLSIPNQDAMNTPDLWLTSLYINDNDINAIIFGGWHTQYASDIYFYQFNSNGIGYQITEDNEYQYNVYLDGLEIDQPINQIFGLNGLYDIVIKEISGLETTNSFTLHMNAPIITSGSQFVQDSYEIVADQPFTMISLDNGVTYQTIPETTTYLLIGLDNGIYDLKVMTALGETSKSVKVIFDNISPDIEILTSAVNDQGSGYENESYYTFSDYIIYDNCIYYANNPHPGTLYKINLELESYQTSFETKIKVLPSNVKFMQLEGNKLYIFYLQENMFSVIDLSKLSTEDGYYKEYMTSLEINTYDEYAKSAAIINNFLVIFLDYTSSTEKDDALIIYDLRLDFDDPDFETVYTPDFLVDNQYYARSLYGYEDLLICRSYDSNTHNSFITVYDFTLTPGDPGFEKQIDLGLENITKAFDFRAFDDGKLFFTYKDISNYDKINSALIDFSKAENEEGFITYLDIETLEYLVPKYLVLEDDLLFVYLDQPENYEGDRTILMFDLTEIENDSSHYQELSTHIFAEDEVMTSHIVVYNHQLFIYTNNYEFATLSKNYIHSIFFEEELILSITDDYLITSMEIRLDGLQIELNRLKQISIPGVYEITVIDASGNESIETYTVE